MFGIDWDWLQKDFSGETKYITAQQILGGDFICPYAVSKTRLVPYSSEQFASLHDSLPSVTDLGWCRQNKMILLPGPPIAMSLLDVHALKPEYLKLGPFCHDNVNKRFAQSDKIEALCWIAFHKEELVDTLPDQRAPVAELMTISNVAEAVWVLTIRKAVHGIHLPEHLYLRTSSMNSRGECVFVGLFGDDVLCVDDYWFGEGRYFRLGFARSRKFEGLKS
jgi:hypothetical protein